MVVCNSVQLYQKGKYNYKLKKRLDCKYQLPSDVRVKKFPNVSASLIIFSHIIE